MSLGAYQAAVTRARLTGQPVPIGNQGLVVYPAGNVGTPGGGFGGARPAGLPVPPIPPATVPALAQPVAPSTPFSAAGVQGQPGSPSGAAVAPPAALPATQPTIPMVDDFGRPIPTITVTPQPSQVQAPLNQANPAFTAGIPGAVGTQSGPPAPTPLATVDVTARRYRAQHGLSTPDDTDALNDAESLAAARAGRTYLDPSLASQYATAGGYGPRTNVVNALSLPPAATSPQPAQQVAQNLLLQGVY